MSACLVLTRPRASAEQFAQAARAQGWTGEVVIAPVLDIVLGTVPQAALATARTVIVTSRHAVAALAQGRAARDLALWAVGPGTAQAARDAGFRNLSEAGGDARALMRDLQAAGAQGPFLHLRGSHVAVDIAGDLRALGHVAQSCEVYRQDRLPLSGQVRARLQSGGIFVLPVFSPRSAALLAADVAQLDISAAQLHLIAISAAAAAPFDPLPVASARIAARPDAREMLAALAATQAELEPLEKPS